MNDAEEATAVEASVEVDYVTLREAGVTYLETILPDGSKQELFIVGTAHVSDESWYEDSTPFFCFLLFSFFFLTLI